MTRLKFMEKLSVELNFLPSDEKENALRFYEEYFDEAGAENEKDVISELGSPKSVAKKILRESKLQYENFENDILKNNNYKYHEDNEVNNTPIASGNENVTAKNENISAASEEIKSKTDAMYSEILNENKLKESKGKPENSKRIPIWLWLILLVFALPLLVSVIGMVFSVFGVAVGVVVSIIAVVFSIFIGSLAVGAALLVSGAAFLAIAVTSIVNGGMIFLPMGIALILLSVGIVLTYFSVILNINVIKWTFTKCLKGIVKAFGSSCSFIYKKFIRR